MLHIFTVEMGLLYFRVNVFTQKDNWTTLCNLKSKSLQGFFFFFNTTSMYTEEVFFLLLLVN